MRSVSRCVRVFIYGRRGQSGGVLAEFAIVTPVLAMLLVGIAGLSTYLIQVELLNSAVEAGLLHVTKNGWSWSNPNNQSVVVAAVNAAGDNAVSSASAICYYGCPTNSGVVSTGTSCNYSNTAPSPPATCSGVTPGLTAAPGQYVQVTASAPISNPVAGALAALFNVTLPTTISLTATTRAK